MLFNALHFETIGNCNRTCPTCIRNSHPDQAETLSWFQGNLLEADLIYQALDEAVALGFKGRVILSHYNEPLMDKRLPEIAHRVRTYPVEEVYLHTNGDFLTPELAAALDGALDHLQITLYMDSNKAAERAAWIPTLFQKTVTGITTVAQSPHMATHFSPLPETQERIRKVQGRPCNLTPQVIINHRQQFLLCCDDMVGNFNLGTFPETSIQKFWFDEAQKIRADLSQAGGRSKYPYCLSCPK
jgi:hypothetical protein